MQTSEFDFTLPSRDISDELTRREVVCSRFACAICGECPASLATRCANLDCQEVACYSCVVKEDPTLKKCRFCGKKARGDSKQRCVDLVLNDAISAAYPDMRRETTVDMVQARHVKECVDYVREVGNSTEMQVQGKSHSYVQEATMLIYGHSKNATLQKWLKQSFCKCSPPYVCINRLAKSGKAFISCPAFNLDEKTRTGKSSTGCDFFKFV
jgi:hypothetical protein